MDEQWERAEIRFHIREDMGSGHLSGPGYSANLQFVARAWVRDEQREIAASHRLPIALWPGVDRLPRQDSPEQQALLADLLAQLQRDGWELLPQRGEEWWRRRLRRPYISRPGWWQRFVRRWRR